MLPLMNKSITFRISNRLGLVLVLVLVGMWTVIGCEGDDSKPGEGVACEYSHQCESGLTCCDFGVCQESCNVVIGHDPCEGANVKVSNCTCSALVQNPGGKLHSEPCTSDAECKYGLCHSSPEIAGFKFCTKNPYCGPTTECSSDNSNGKTYFAQLYNNNSHPNETAKEICVQECKFATDCPSDYTACETVTGVRKTCTAK